MKYRIIFLALILLDNEANPTFMVTPFQDSFLIGTNGHVFGMLA